MKELVLLVLLESGRGVFYPMPSMDVCEHWASETAAYPHVKAVECVYESREQTQGPMFVWKEGVEG